MALGSTTTAGKQTLQDTVPLACKALSGGKLYYWEYGNEPNLYAQQNWNVGTYVDEYKQGTSQIIQLVKQHCPGLSLDFMAPSFSGAGTGFDAATAVDGIDGAVDLAAFSTHK